MIPFIDTFWKEIIATLLVLVIYVVLRAVAGGVIKRHTHKHGLAKERSIYISKFFTFSFTSLLLIAIGFIWDFSFKGVFASFFAVAGVALFASWSMLSNMTASVILFFNAPFKIGSSIKILDGDDSVEGKVKDITFFAIIIEDADKNIVSYPNNVAIQKAIIQKREHHEKQSTRKVSAAKPVRPRN